ncbi:3-deoxy-manno-octulosonate-8-phosphatase KdsC [Alteromonas facilis]|uniref:3-deoxy-manno-octulosonate-8-phosphatase KdsC n=1 Tax=Alteromonas facilis TaxID=2048004 RepID=UPI000C289017|nr:3-deoxy-manno-octulosonate-8-phosphatase KdsC [Alteromonas facilis]
MQTLYGDMPESLYTALSKIKLLVCDIDGVFSDGRIYLGNAGEELKAFHTRDGFGFKALQSIGLQTAVITGRNSAIVQDRMTALKTNYILQGKEDKYSALSALLDEINLAPESVATIGDDVPDLGMFSLAGTSIAVQDAHPLVLQKADWITTQRGGFGAVREVCDVFLQVHDALDNIAGASI